MKNKLELIGLTFLLFNWRYNLSNTNEKKEYNSDFTQKHENNVKNITLCVTLYFI